MTDLSTMTAAKLVALHDERCAEADRIGRPWKRPKHELVAMIGALGEHAKHDESPKAAESDKATVGALVAKLLSDPGLGYGEIVAAVKERFPEAQTSARSVASTACMLRRKGVEVPSRRQRA